jgi:hypothetical protein
VLQQTTLPTYALFWKKIFKNMDETSIITSPRMLDSNATVTGFSLKRLSYKQALNKFIHLLKNYIYIKLYPTNKNVWC